MHEERTGATAPPAPEARTPRPPAAAATPRRAALRSLGALASRALGAGAAAGLARTASAFQRGAHGPANDDPELFVVQRLTQGFQLAEYRRAQSLGALAWLEEQLDPDSIDDSVLDARLATFQTLDLSAKELYDGYLAPGAPGNQAVPVLELEAAAVLRSVLSERQLLERMVEFWSDHFSVDHLDGPVRILKTVEDRDVIRQHALGKFPDLLQADAESPAMLYYLDNYANTATAPQENYSRELMELHTMGVDGGFSENDVKEVARCFTGWSVRTNQASPLFGTFVFRATDHDNGSKTVLGAPITVGGKGDGDAVLSLLANHPSTARFIARKLCVWLWSESPSDALVDRVAATYAATGGDIKEMIRTIVRAALAAMTSESPIGSPGPKFRRPLSLVGGLLRALEVEPTAFQGLLQSLSRMGQVPFRWPAPNGYPDSVFAWGANLLPRWEFVSELASGGLPGVQVSATHLLALLNGAGGSSWADNIDLLLTGGRLEAEDRAELEAYLASFPTLTQAALREAIGLAATSPSYQFH